MQIFISLRKNCSNWCYQDGMILLNVWRSSKARVYIIDLSGYYVTANTVFNLEPP